MRSVRWALVVVACVIACAPSAAAAWATPATGGASRFGGAIDWVSWGTRSEVLDLSGAGDARERHDVRRP